MDFSIFLVPAMPGQERGSEMKKLVFFLMIGLFVAVGAAQAKLLVDVVSDGDCEGTVINKPGWWAINGGARVSGAGVNGSKCIELTGLSSMALNGDYMNVAGEKHTLKLDYQTDPDFIGGGASGYHYVQIRFFDANDAVVKAPTIELVATYGAWKTFEWTTANPCPANVVRVDVAVLAIWGGTTNSVLRVDNVQLYQTYTTYPAGAVHVWAPQAVLPDPTNWNVEINWGSRPTPGDHVIIGNNTTGVWPVVDANTLPVQILAVGWWGPASGEQFRHNELYITDGGSITVSDINSTPAFGPSFMRLANAFDSEGVVYMDGGELTTMNLQVGADGDGVFNQSGGTVRITGVNGLATPNQAGGIGTGLYDMTGDAVLLLAGDSRTSVNTLVTDGNLKAYNGARQLVVDYDVTTPGWTTVKPQACAALPTADLTGDCKVDVQDFALLVSEWLFDTSMPVDLVWEAAMDTDPVLAANWALRSPSSNNYEISGGKMTIYSGTLGALNAVVDTAPANYFADTLKIWADLLTITNSGTVDPIANPYGTTIWFITDSDKAAYGINRFTVHRISETEQVLSLVSNNNTTLIQLTGFGTGMISIYAEVVPNGTGGTITFDATDGTKSYIDQVVTYTNGQAGPVAGGSYVTISGLGYEGEVDYLKVVTETNQVIHYNLGGDPTKINLQDFAVMASNWLVNNSY